MHRITSLRVGRFLLDGRPQKQCITTSIPVPVMYGAMAVYYMRYGVLEDCHSRNIQMHRFEHYMTKPLLGYVYSYAACDCKVILLVYVYSNAACDCKLYSVTIQY